MDITDKTNLTAVPADRAGTPIATSIKSVSNSNVGTDVAKLSLVDTSLPSTQSLDQQLENAVSRINDYVQNVQRTIKFSVDETSGKDVVKILDKQTEEVIRQIPSEEVLAIARNIADYTADTISIFTSRA